MHDLHLTSGEVKFLVTGELKSTVLEDGAGRKRQIDGLFQSEVSQIWFKYT
jgi:hypothetical protein